MGEKKRKSLRKGRPPQHGGYSLICGRRELVHRHRRLREYLENCREGLVRDVAGSEEALSEQQRIMIDRIVSRLSICRLIEIYVEKTAVFTEDGRLVSPLADNYLAYSNSIDRALVALGLDRKKAYQVLDLGRYLEKKEREKEKTNE
jgi:hypothetical protein